MKSRYRTYSKSQLDRDIHAQVLAELEQYKDEVYDKITKDVCAQALAVCFTALELMGWRQKRLTAYREQVDAVCEMMFHGVLGREYTTRDALQHLKEKYGIDMSEVGYRFGEGGDE